MRRELRMEGVPIQAVVETGTLVLTSGYGGLFPKGLPIGQVVAVRDDSTALVKEIRITAAADLDRLEEVFLLAGADAAPGVDAVGEP
ncbi:MAG: hypothetical protein GF330_11650 [Candidatus Eisenbacteria bacterium]|nr:hypothetical protein [Candidatus Eisenbacteria bacterium]